MGLGPSSAGQGVTSSGPKLHGVRGGPFPPLPSALWLAPALLHPSPQGLPLVCGGGSPRSSSPPLELRLGLCPSCSLRSSSSKLAQLTLEQILEHLDSLRLNLTNTKQNCRHPGPPARAGPERVGAAPELEGRLRLSLPLLPRPPPPSSF